MLDTKSIINHLHNPPINTLGDIVRRQVYFHNLLIIPSSLRSLTQFRIQNGDHTTTYNSEILFGINIYEDKLIYLFNQVFLMERDENQIIKL